MKKKIAFVSTMTGERWGGSEELWSQTAVELAKQGVPVVASVKSYSSPHERILNLAQVGIRLQFRRENYSFSKRLWRRMAGLRDKSWPVTELEKFFALEDPALVVFSDGGPLSSFELLEICVSKKLPFVTIGQANLEYWWPDDDEAARYRKAVMSARRCYFVSKANQRLVEKQIGIELPNAEIIRNPFNVDYNVVSSWPPLDDDSELRLACVGRIYPPSKGQDLLLEALANPLWRQRSWRLTFYGEGSMRNCLERMVLRLGLQDRVVFAGFCRSVEKIWIENHVLVMPSRYEGLPLAMVEAMICARPVVATDVAGHSEILEDGVTGFLAQAPTALSLISTLEILWSKRAELKGMGEAAAKSIREQIPADPARIFSEKIKALVN